MKTTLASLCVFLPLPLGISAASTIDSTNQFAWSANFGWTNWRPDFDATHTEGVTVNEFVLSGYVHAANVGWINLGNGDPADRIQYKNNSGTDFGVNLVLSDKEYDPTYQSLHALPGDPAQARYALLRGYAWGANIGWIAFEPSGNPRVSLYTGAMSGYAYSANCGWINLNSIDTGPSPAQHFVRTDHILMGADTNANGIADAWEYLYYNSLLAAGAQNTSPSGSGMTLLQYYQDGMNPLLPNAGLRITAISANAGGTMVQLTFTSTPSRLYSILSSTDLALPLSSWTDSDLFSPASGTTTTRLVTEASAPKRFFRVKTMRPLP